jgi:tetratricopeptide (TPR) repeat protein
MDPSQSPQVRPFTYTLIPCDDREEVREQQFNGSSDAELRAMVKKYFQRVGLSNAQREELSHHFIDKAEENGKRFGVQGSSESAPCSERAPVRQELIEAAVDTSSFEIVPVTLPMPHNGFVGTSLYIDDVGQYKSLPVNTRASRLVQREVRGDALLMANHDDPALDSWERVDCGLPVYRELAAHPTSGALDTSDAKQMAQAAMARESLAKRITDDDVCQAKESKEKGNYCFGQGDLDAAIAAYSVAIDRTEGRRDLRPDEAELLQLRISCLLNRSLCRSKLRLFREALHDGQSAMALDAKNPKAHYRVAVALSGLGEYDEAEETIRSAQEHFGPSAEFEQLLAIIDDERRRWRREQKAKFAKMF